MFLSDELTTKHFFAGDFFIVFVSIHHLVWRMNFFVLNCYFCIDGPSHCLMLLHLLHFALKFQLLI